jgi:tryptophan-rich sensory protein
MPPNDAKRRSTDRLWLATFLIFVVVPSTLIAFATVPGEWYDSLIKPAFIPPNWVFIPVWMLLYVLIAIAGWRVFLRNPDGAAMWAWIAQLGINWHWPPVFFGLKMVGLAIVVIAGMLTAILSFMFLVRRLDRVAFWCFVPYFAWVGYSALINVSIAILN